MGIQKLRLLPPLMGVLCGLMIQACDSTPSEDKLRGISDIQGQEAARNQIAAEKKYLETKATVMEQDLQRRQLFYQALAGTYEGTLRVNQSDFKIRMTLAPSLPRYVPTDRVRTVEEVAADLTNLYFNIQVVQWNPENNLGSVGCLVTNIRPDIVKGKINVASENCANFYSFQIADDFASTSKGLGRNSGEIANLITEGKVDVVPQILGKMQPTTNANIYTFTAERVRE